MHDFILKEILKSDLKKEIENIGFDKSYISQVSLKFEYKNIKIYNLTNPQIHILKQTAISMGCDCATHREVLTNEIEASDCILTGSISQLNKIADKLQNQPFRMKELGKQIKNFCEINHKNTTKIMGILNLTSNSFSDGGLYDNFDNAKTHLLKLINDGADIIDIGAESTKPYSSEVSSNKQLTKIIPLLEYIKVNNINIPISIDTRNSEVVKKCLEYTCVKYINDVSGLEYDSKIAETIANSNVFVIIQHTKGTPENMQISPHYEHLMDEIYLDLKQRIDYANSKGISKEKIIIDPGIGFGKTQDHNFEIIRRIQELYGLKCPVLLGLSRKSLLNMTKNTNDEKDIFTCALNALAIENKVDIIRVHNVKLHRKLIQLLIN